MSALEIIQDRGMEAIDRFYSSYRGIVIDNKDPGNQNRLKVIVPSISVDSLLWAYPKGQDASAQSGCKGLTPRIGSMVWVEYENGDPMYPIWNYGHWAEEEIPSDLNDPNVCGIVTPNGNKIIIHDINGTFKLSIKKENSEKVVTIDIMDDRIIFNNGNKGGIPISSNIVERLNNLENSINNLKTLLTTANANITPGDGGLSILTTLLSWSSRPVNQTNIDNIENKDILQ